MERSIYFNMEMILTFLSSPFKKISSLTQSPAGEHNPYLYIPEVSQPQYKALQSAFEIHPMNF